MIDPRGTATAGDDALDHEGVRCAPGSLRRGAASPGPFYFGCPGRALFGWYDVPAGARRRCGVVICNPIGDDCVRAHRPLRHLSRRLTGAGFVVLRFDFHGTGDSSGDDRQPDRVKTWLEDVGLAVAELRARSGVPAIAVVGLRLGATLAMMAAAESAGVDSLVLWGPHARGGDHVTESTRLHRMHRMLEPRSFAGGPPSRDDGEEALGFLLTHATIADLAALDVRSARTPPAQRALLVSDGGAPAELAILEHLRALDVAVERRVLAGSQQFLLEIPHKSRLPEEAVEAIVGWLSELHRETDPPVPNPTDPRAGAPFSEEPLFFGGRRSLFGILHHPASAEPRAGLPPIVLVSAGTVHRIGPHRFYVALARRWARLGFPVLRVDLSGVGDSPGGADGVENVTYPRDGVHDVEDAMEVLGARTGARRFVVAGLCSGGDFAFQVGMRDGRVAGAVIMNPRTFCVNDLEQVEASGQAPGGSGASGVAHRLLRRAFGLVADRREGEARVPASLRRMATRGVDTLLVVSERDLGVHYVDTHWGEAMRALSGVPGFRREDVAGTDHNFTSLWSQERVSDLVTEHLARRYLT